MMGTRPPSSQVSAVPFRTQLSPAEPLHLVSGKFHIDEIMTQQTSDHSSVVRYLDASIPFREVVSLRTNLTTGHTKMIKLLGRVAVLTPAHTRKERIKKMHGILNGWVLMHWGTNAIKP